MVIGNGQLAQAFIGIDRGDVCIFASGVANSNCKEESEFQREKKLLEETLTTCQEKKFVYFSSCALSAENYPKNEYYQHKYAMEELIKSKTKSYYIFRIPQLFGKLKHHKTLINFLYKSIIEEKKMTLYDEAYRYVIEIDDLKNLVINYLDFTTHSTVVDLGNPYRYKVLDIVKIFENLLGKKAEFDLIQKNDGYELDFKEMFEFMQEHNINMDFSKDYLIKKLENLI
jgi:hypothetical protein